MKIRRIHDKCYSCGACQLACSFHHTGSFWPAKSSIQVYRKPREGRIIWKIDTSCDMCRGEAGPRCVEACKYDALLPETDRGREGESASS